jgi:hypothetical protein
MVEEESRIVQADMMRLLRLRASNPPQGSQHLEEALAGGGSWQTLEQVQHQQQQQSRQGRDADHDGGDEFYPLPPPVPPPYFAGDIVICVSEGFVGGGMIDEYKVKNLWHYQKDVFFAFDYLRLKLYVCFATNSSRLLHRLVRPPRQYRTSNLTPRSTIGRIIRA